MKDNTNPFLITNWIKKSTAAEMERSNCHERTFFRFKSVGKAKKKKSFSTFPWSIQFQEELLRFKKRFSLLTTEITIRWNSTNHAKTFLHVLLQKWKSDPVLPKEEWIDGSSNESIIKNRNREKKMTVLGDAGASMNKKTLGTLFVEALVGVSPNSISVFRKKLKIDDLLKKTFL